MQVMQGAPGGAALLLKAPRGAPSTGASSGRCAPAHDVWAGGPVRGLPPPPLGSDADNGEAASQGSGAMPAPTGRLGSPRRGHGRAEGVDT